MHFYLFLFLKYPVFSHCSNQKQASKKTPKTESQITVSKENLSQVFKN